MKYNPLIVLRSVLLLSLKPLPEMCAASCTLSVLGLNEELDVWSFSE